jgi:DNA-binding NarL/FixJ family response regulator
LELGELDGIATARQIKERSPETEVLMFSMHDDEYLIRLSLSAGARSFVLKSEGAEALVRAIECASEHKAFCAGKAAETLLKSVRMSRSDENSLLTDREREVVRLLAGGKSNKQAALNLGISVKTVETHRAAIMRKLGCNSIVRLVRYAVRERFVKA